jgi:uncharacterized protein (TIGR00251 family)
MTPFEPVDEAGAVRFDILVQPRAARPRIGPVTGDRLKVAVTAPPVDGEANAAVARALACALGVPARAIEITRGEGSRRKTVRVAGASRAQVLALGRPT